METYSRGAKLKKLREDKGLSHAAVGKEVAKLLRRKAIGKGTVWKWEQSDSPDIELEVFFALADFYEMDPRELATGKPSAKSELPSRRKALIEAYGRLPDEIRKPIRALIEGLSTALSPTYQAWSIKQAALAKRRDTIHEVD